VHVCVSKDEVEIGNISRDDMAAIGRLQVLSSGAHASSRFAVARELV
jgi:hypothetical protein